MPHELRQKIDEILRKDFDLQLVRAMEEQRQVARFYRQHQPRARHGIGAMTMAVHPLFDWVARAKYGKDADDPKFWRWVRKKEEAFRVQARPEKTTVVAPGLQGLVGVTRGARRLSKNYGKL